MPFTLSHIAAALPLARTPLIPSALAIGTMTPDLFYYLPVTIDRTTAHSWLGVVTVDLVSGLALVFLWQFLLRQPVVDHMPLWVRTRLGGGEWMSTKRRHWPRLALLTIASVLLGCATHVIWDSFTHDGELVHAVPVLFEQVGPLRVMKWLQHASSVLGALAIVLFVLRWKRKAEVRDAPPTKLGTRGRAIGRIAVFGVGLAVSLYAWLRGIFAHGYTWIDNALLFYTVTIGISTAGLAVVFVSVVWHGLPVRRVIPSSDAERRATPRD